MSKSLIAQQKMIKTPPLLVMSKIKNYWTSSTHMTVCQCNWPISWPPPHWPPGHAEKKMAAIFDLITTSKIFFKKNFKCTPCPKYWTVTSTLMPFEHSRKQQNVGYTDATIGCSLKQPKSYTKYFSSQFVHTWSGAYSTHRSNCWTMWIGVSPLSIHNINWCTQEVSSSASVPAIFLTICEMKRSSNFKQI